jgi:putative addiction module killer protein
MKRVVESESFAKWLLGLKDIKGKAIIRRRIERLQQGNAGDSKHINGGIYELRIHYGAGYRIYYKEVEGKIIILLYGGDKGSQQRDIERAKEIASQWEE